MTLAEKIKEQLAKRTSTETVDERRAKFNGVPTSYLLEWFADFYEKHRDILPTREGGGGPFTNDEWQRLYRPFDAMRFELEQRGQHATIKSIMRSLERCSPRRWSR